MIHFKWLLALAGCGFLAAQSISYTYDAAGRLSSVAYPNGETQSYLYDPAGNLLRRLRATAGSYSGLSDSVGKPGTDGTFPARAKLTGRSQKFEVPIWRDFSHLQYAGG